MIVSGGRCHIAWQYMHSFLERLAAMPETEAVVVLSSATGTATRPSFDEFSDFDIGLIVDVPVAPCEWHCDPATTYHLIADRMPAWLPNFSFEVPVPWGALEVNVHQLIYDYEADKRTRWSDGKCEAYACTGCIFFDRCGRFAALIRRKAAECAAERADRILRLASRLEWDVTLLPRRQAARGQLVGAHHVLGRALDELVEACFLLSGRFVPDHRWRYYVLREEGLLADVELELLRQATQCDPTSAQDLERRVSALSHLWASIRARFRHLPDDPYRAFAAAQLQLRETTHADTARTHGDENAYNAANFRLDAPPRAI